MFFLMLKMAAPIRGLQAIREAIVDVYAGDLINDEEFCLLYDLNQSREVFPYWKYDRFDFEQLDEVQCKTELRFAKEDILQLADMLRIPEKIVVKSQRTVCYGIEALCILLKRLAYRCRYTDMVATFGRNPTEICLIFNEIVDHVFDEHSHSFIHSFIHSFMFYIKQVYLRQLCS